MKNKGVQVQNGLALLLGFGIIMLYGIAAGALSLSVFSVCFVTDHTPQPMIAAGASGEGGINARPTAYGHASARCNFISPPAWGVTLQCLLYPLHYAISIRTPAWGVTFQLCPLSQRHQFQFAPRVGGDSKNTQNSIQLFMHFHRFMRLLF